MNIENSLEKKMKVETIKKKVYELEELALKITNNGIEIIKTTPVIEFDIPTYEGYDPLKGNKWGVPSEEIREMQSDTVRLYQRWYSASLHFIEEYLNEDRNEEFTEIYKIIINFLQPEGSMYSSKKEDINTFINKLDIQRGILLSVPDVIEIKEMNLCKLISADFVEKELEESEVLFNTKYIRGAGALAGVALEKHLVTMCQLNNVSYKLKDTIDSLATHLYKNKDLNITEFKKIQYLASIRNRCDHPDIITKEDVKELIDGTKKFINTV